MWSKTKIKYKITDEYNAADYYVENSVHSIETYFFDSLVSGTGMFFQEAKSNLLQKLNIKQRNLIRLVEFVKSLEEPK